MYSVSCFDFQALWQDLSGFVSSLNCCSSLFVTFFAGIRIASKCIRMHFSASGYPPFQQLVQCVWMPLLGIQMQFLASEYHPWVSGYPPPQQPRSFTQCIRMFLLASEYYFLASECIVWHPDTLFQNFKIRF